MLHLKQKYQYVIVGIWHSSQDFGNPASLIRVLGLDWIAASCWSAPREAANDGYNTLLGVLYSLGRTGLNFQHLALIWPSPGYHRHLGKQTRGDFSLLGSLNVFLFVSLPFQETKIKIKKEIVGV